MNDGYRRLVKKRCSSPNSDTFSGKAIAVSVADSAAASLFQTLYQAVRTSTIASDGSSSRFGQSYSASVPRRISALSIIDKVEPR